MSEAETAAAAIGAEPAPQAPTGVLPSQELTRAIEAEWVNSGDYRIRPEAIQPASIDLRLGDLAARRRWHPEHRQRLAELPRRLLHGSLLLFGPGDMLEADNVHARDLQLHRDPVLIHGNVERAVTMDVGAELAMRLLRDRGRRQ